MPFALGQRWISDTEGDLGLGTIVAMDTRTITLLFPASGETRLYTRNEAPITRVLFGNGDVITSQEGWQLQINHVEHANNLVIYHGKEVGSDADVSLKEIMLANHLTFSKPQDRLFAGQIDRLNRFTLRYQTRLYQSEQYSLPYSGLRGIRANLIPHQLHIAHEVSQRYAPRVLLADEVGLGKTIEAGTIIHQRLLSGSAERILIIVPDSLQHQWLVEMLRRFNLRFSLFDESRYNETLLDSDNPFETEQLVICSLNFVYRNKQRLEALLDAEWDLLVVDEAHHLVWSENEVSSAYRAVEKLAQVIPAVLLLTATPEQLGLESHFARLRLLDADRFHDYQTFVAEQAHYEPIAKIVNHLLSNEALTEPQLLQLEQLLGHTLPELSNGSTANKAEQYPSERQVLIQQLMDRHGTSRVLFKNTRQGVKGFPQRQLQAIALPLPSQYQTAIRVNNLMNAKQSLMQKAQAMLYPEQIFQALEGDEVNWLTFDPRVQWLLTLLTEHRDEKILVICANAQTVLQLASYLREREAIHAALFHEGLTLLERDRAAAYFASYEQGAQVLICSEIGSEGRNFQFAHKVVMFDLPMNPDLLEQRIGRLDRIGQQHTVEIIVPYLENTAQSVLLRWFHEGLDAFEHTCPTGRVLFDAQQERLLNYLASPNHLESFDELLAETQTQHQQLKGQLESGRDRLLELHSQGGESAQRLVNEIAQQDSTVELVSFAFTLFDIIGIDQEDISDNLLLIKPSDHMLFPDFPGIPAEGCLVTFDRETALSREDSQFLSWEHPIIRNGIDLILSNDTGSTAVALLKNKALPVGTLLLELIYVVETQAPKSLQLQRFLPAVPLRLLVDAKGQDLASKVSFDQLNKQLSPINRHNAGKIVQTVQADIRHRLSHATTLVEQQANSLITEAQQRASNVLQAELDRLRALQQVNATIRDDEIASLEQQRVEILHALQHAQCRLDALRLIVVTHQ